MKQKAWILPFLIIGAALWLFTAYRAATLSFTCDESQTWLEFVSASYADILTLSETSANNHILNTLLVKIAGSAFGTSEFALRLPNVLAHGVYLLFSFLLLRRLTDNKVLLFFGFILLNMNPFMLDFFSLARGYGMALALTMASLCHFVKHMQTGQTGPGAWTFVFAALAVLANFSWLPFYAALLGAFNVYTIGGKASVKNLVKANGISLLVTALLFAICYEPVRKLIKLGALYDGGKDGFWADTVVSVVRSTSYSAGHSSLFAWVLWTLIGLTILLQLYVIVKQWRTKSQTILQDPTTIFFILLVVPALCSVALHLLAGTNYPTDRMALLYLPLLFINLVMSSKELGRPLVLPAAAGIIMFLHTAFAINLDRTWLWYYDAGTRSALNDLRNEVKGNEQLVLGVNWMFVNTVNFYKQTEHLDWLRVVNIDEETGNCEYFYVMEPVPAHSRLVRSYALGAVALLRK